VLLSLLVSYGLPAATATPVASPSAPPLERRKDTIVGTKINLGGDYMSPLNATPQQIKLAICKTTHAKLVEFGYPDLPMAKVEETYDKAIAGEPKGSDIIDMFVYGDIEAFEEQADMKLIPEVES
tara:strand:- start:14 stop:388 length:375 start_codon:yes stop_codon:yes gene_type:complete